MDVENNIIDHFQIVTEYLFYYIYCVIYMRINKLIIRRKIIWN